MDNTKMMVKAYQLKQAIEAETIGIEENGIKITIGGDLKVKEILVNNIENIALKDAVNNAIRKVQELQVLKIKEMSDLMDVL